jgi:outer membrane protein assembly factor BamB
MPALRVLVVCGALWVAVATSSPSAVAADWLQPGYDASQSGHSPVEQLVGAGNVGRLHQVWRGPGGGGVAVSATQIVVSGGRWDAFGPSPRSHALRVYARFTRRLLWRASGAVGAPAVSGGVVYIVTERGLEAYALDCASDGSVCAPLWRAETTGAHSPVVAHDEVYLRTASELVAYPTTCSTPCRPAWRGELGAGVGYPAAHGGIVYASSEEQPGVYAFPAQCATGGARCEPLWKGLVEDRPASLTSPAVGEGTVVLHTHGFRSGMGFSRIVAFPAACGTAGVTCMPRWQAEVPWTPGGSNSSRATTPAVGAGVAYLAIDPGLRAYALDCATGGATCEPLWLAERPGVPHASDFSGGSPTLANGVVYHPALERLWAFRAACPFGHCGPLWSVPAPGASGRPAVADGRVYVPGYGTWEYALDGVRPWGALVQPAGPHGCVSRFGHEGCGRARRLARVTDLAVSPDGRFVYAAARGGGALVAFARDRDSGALTQLPGPAGCIASWQPERGGCARARRLGRPTELELSRDGRNLYAVGGGSTITTFRRDSRTGKVRQLPGVAGCLGPSGRCRPLRRPGRDSYPLAELVLDRAGRHLYFNGGDSTVRLAVRNPHTGALREARRRCVAGAEASRAAKRSCRRDAAVGGSFYLVLAMSGDGRHMYIGSDIDFGAIAVFRRNRRTGRLERLRGRAGCIAVDRPRRCAQPPPPFPAGTPWDLSLDPRGRTLYVAEGYGCCPERLRTFRRSQRTGALRPPVRPAGCLSRGDAECRPLDELLRTAPLVSDDGRSAYAITEDGDLMVFRVGARGALIPQDGQWRCLAALATSSDPAPGKCVEARGLRDASRLAASPDGRHLYVGAHGNSIAVFEPRRD